jgi:hypothetical protein
MLQIYFLIVQVQTFTFIEYAIAARGARRSATRIRARCRLSWKLSFDYLPGGFGETTVPRSLNRFKTSEIVWRTMPSSRPIFAPDNPASCIPIIRAFISVVRGRSFIANTRILHNAKIGPSLNVKKISSEESEIPSIHVKDISESAQNHQLRLACIYQWTWKS